MKDYRPFHEALDVSIDADDFETWQQLQLLMEKKNFRSGLTPTRKQVDLAWAYLKGGKAEGPEVPVRPVHRRVLPSKKAKGPVVRSFVWVHRRSGVLVKQANRDLVFKGKRYRKGMFVPKDLPKDFV